MTPRERAEALYQKWLEPDYILDPIEVIESAFRAERADELEMRAEELDSVGPLPSHIVADGLRARAATLRGGT